MRKYITPDGAIFAGSTAEEIVTAMRDRGFYPSAGPALHIYVADVISRLALYNNEPIDAELSKDVCESFIRILVEKDYFHEVLEN